MVFLLTDLCDGNIDYVIIAETTTHEDIEDIISRVKEENEDGWTSNEIIDQLPEDCKVFSKMGSDEVQHIYY